MWNDSQDCLIERNIIIDCDTGIALGNSHRDPEFATHCTRFIIRNNFVTRAPENGILADYTKDCKIIHNTIHDPQNRLRRLIRLVHDNDGLMVSHNLLSGPPMRIETDSDVRFCGNITKDLTNSFVNARVGNLHLKCKILGVTDEFFRLPDATSDIDCEPRDDPADIGADEI